MYRKDKIRILIVDDHPAVRHGIKLVIRDCSDIKIIGEAKNIREAINLCAKNPPDLILMDILLPDVDGIETSTEILKKWPDIKIILLTSFINNNLLTKSLHAGIAGYLLKNYSGKPLLML
jgi:NarL family two-component system response regulator LiaR